MLVKVPYNNSHIDIRVPDDAAVYRTSYDGPAMGARELVLKALSDPVECSPFSETLGKSGAKSAAVVVSDITRPIPYTDFLNVLLEEIEAAAVPVENIVIIIATGMHRPSTAAEREHMFGPEVCGQYRMVDHHAEKADELLSIDGTSRAGRPIELNRLFVEADFRIVTGLVEPHFMAGFSGGRKSVCPGLCSLETVKMFHGYSFLNNPSATNGNLEGNPLHDEALSIARQANVDFCVNLVVNGKHQLVGAYAGDLEASHETACKFVNRHACPPVQADKDVVLTSSGGYPLDATFYQCVKGMTSCLPAVRTGGVVVSVGSCSEGIGGPEYRSIMRKYSGTWREFIRDLQSTDKVIKDQWEFQMQTRVLEHVGDDNLIFVTGGLSASDLDGLCVRGVHVSEDQAQNEVQELLDGFVREGRSLAVIPEGPYCAPAPKDTANR